jgi:hypothetical protein
MSKELEQLYKIAPLYQELFPKQLELALHPNRFTASLTGSRAGKTTACAVIAIQELISNPNCLGVYLALTDKSVINIFMPIVRPLLAKYSIKAKITSDDIQFSNGSRLIVLGANHIHKVETFRGLKLKFCIIDECASFNQKILNYLIDEIMIQRLSDLQGRLMLIGTPAAHCSGLFYDVTNNLEEGWGLVNWTVFDNPYMTKQALMDVELYMKRKQCERQNPKLRREYDGEWAADDDELLVRQPTLTSLPNHYNLELWRSVIGVDFGFNDETAFSVIGWERNNPKAYVIETFGVTGEQASKSGLGMVTYIGNILNDLKDKYKPVKIVGDPAGASKILMDEFLFKHKVFMESAVKKDKAHYIEIMNDALVNQALVFHPTQTKELQREISKLVWNEERTREREGMKCDHFDATLYAYREALAYVEKIPARYVPKTPEQIGQEMIQQQVITDMERAASRRGDDFFNDLSNFLD